MKTRNRAIVAAACLLAPAWLFAQNQTPPPAPAPAPTPAPAPVQHAPAQPAPAPAQPEASPNVPSNGINPAGTPMNPKDAKNLIRPSIGNTPAPATPAANPNMPAGTPATVPQSKDAVLVFDEVTHDFGKVFDTTPRKWKATFKNTGSEKLIISQVRPGCGCTAATMEKYEFEPGESGAIDLTWNPAGSGEVQKPVSVSSNDKAEALKTIYIKANIVPLIKLDPPFLQGGSIQSGTDRPLRLLISSRDKDMKIKSVEFEGEKMEYKVVDDDSSNPSPDYPGRHVVEFIVPKNAPVGAFNRMFNVIVEATPEDAKAPVESKHPVRAYAMIVGDLMVTPPFMSVTNAKPKSDFEASVNVVSRSAKPFNILKAEIVESNINDLKVRTEPYADGVTKGVKVILSGNTGEYIGAFRGMIRLTSDVPNEGQTQITFSGMCLASPPTAVINGVPTPVELKPMNAPGKPMTAPAPGSVTPAPHPAPATPAPAPAPAPH